MRPSWFPDWSEEICAVIASGPSVDRKVVESLRGRCKVAVVNKGHELAPWGDLLYAADGRYWEHNPAACAFAGLKVTPDLGAAKRYGLQLVKIISINDQDSDLISMAKWGRIAHGGNSAFQLVNLVTQFGCRRQIWIGFDFHGEHWHGKHVEPLRNPKPQTLDKWAGRFDLNAPHLKALGVDVVNASDVSVLTKYPKMPVEQAFERWGVADVAAA